MFNTLFDPTTWALWIFIPVMRYIFFPSILEMKLRSYRFLVPLFMLVATAVFLGYANDRAIETLITGATLVVMLSIDLWYITNKLQQRNIKIKELEEMHKTRDLLLI